MGSSGRRRVLIAGGGVAALETLLALRRLAEERVDIELLAPHPEFVYRPMLVAEPFGIGEELRFDLAEIAADAQATLRAGALAEIEGDARLARTSTGEEIAFDTLVIACGARPRVPFPEALTFAGPGGAALMTELVRDLERGRVKSVAFAVPGGDGWPLPLYELALLTAAHLRHQEVAGVELLVITPESSPLELFGTEPSERVRHLLTESGIGLFTDSYPAAIRGGHVMLQPAGRVAAERVVALPRLEGPGIEGVPTGRHEFIPVDRFGRVPGLDDVFAAGDATALPIKQGGLAAQLADVVAACIARDAGAPVEPQPFDPVLRGMLLTGGPPSYLRTELLHADAEAPSVAEDALWWPPSKIAGKHLGPYLASLAGPRATDLAVNRNE